MGKEVSHYAPSNSIGWSRFHHAMEKSPTNRIYR